MSSYDANMKMMRKALDYSYAFIRGLYRFSFRNSIRHPAKIIHKKFKFHKTHHQELPDEVEKTKWKTVKYWTIIILVPLVIVTISFSFISQPGKFFSKSGGINVPDLIKFLFLPVLSLIAFIAYCIISSIKKKKIEYYRNKTSAKHIIIKNQHKTDAPDSVPPPEK